MPDKKPQRTLESYLAGLPPDVVFTFERVMDAILAIAPDAAISIKYDMPLFEYSGAYLYVGAWKKHIGLYPVFPLEPALEAEVAPFRARKDTVQFFYNKPMPYDLIARIAAARIGP